jgi:hypothetical protein
MFPTLQSGAGPLPTELFDNLSGLTKMDTFACNDCGLTGPPPAFSAATSLRVRRGKKEGVR